MSNSSNSKNINSYRHSNTYNHYEVTMKKNTIKLKNMDSYFLQLTLIILCIVVWFFQHLNLYMLVYFSLMLKLLLISSFRFN